MNIKVVILFSFLKRIEVNSLEIHPEGGRGREGVGRRKIRNMG